MRGPMTVAIGSPASTPERAETWVGLLRGWAERSPEREVLTFLLDGERESVSVTYDEIDRRARAIATALRQHGLRPGDRVLLLYPPGLDFVLGFVGCLYGGAIAVPAYPPNPGDLERGASRLAAIVEDSEPAALLTTSSILPVRDAGASHAPALGRMEWIASDALDPDEAVAWEPPPLDANAPAFLQYTSGSTGAPKGVVLSHANLFHNSALIHSCFGHDAGTRGVTWLPPYHDMGLIGGILQPLYAGFPTVLLSPIAFLERPLRWLQAVSRHRATTSGGPSFAYELCVRKVRPEDRENLDLSCWRVAFCGAEPIRPETAERFAGAFGPCGFRPEAFYPCYGLAESTLMVTGVQAGHRGRVLSLRPVDLERGRATAASVGEPQRRMVSCGRPGPGLSVRIVDPGSRRERPAGHVGEVWVAGPSVAQGYWLRPRETEATFRARIAGEERAHLRTGDLGFLADGELYLTGRIKDLIIVRGRNLAPQDLEATLAFCHPALRPGCGVVFPLDRDGSEEAVAVQEVRDRHGLDAREVLDACRVALTREHQVPVAAIVLIDPRSLPKTTSGKVQRSETRRRFLGGELSVVAEWRRETHERPETFAEADLAAQTASAAARLDAILRGLLGLASDAPLASDVSIDRLGLDSLRMVELRDRLESAFGISIPLIELSGLSVGTLAARLVPSELPPPSPPPREPRPFSTDRAGRFQPFPLTDLQQAYWAGRQAFFELGHVASHAYFEFDSDALDLARLEEAWQSAIERHPALRTVVLSERQQQVLEHVPRYPIAEVDLRGADAEFRERRLAHTRQRMAQQVHDLTRWPHFEIVAHRLEDRRLRLHVSFDYFMADATSLLLVLRDWGRFYRGVAFPAPELGVTFRDCVIAAERVVDPAAYRRSEEYWHEQIDRLPPAPQLPLDGRPADLEDACVTRQAGRLGAVAWERLKACARARGLTPSSVLLAAYAEVLGTWSESQQFSVNVTHFKRPRLHPDVSDVVGQFASFTFVAFDRRTRTSFAERARQAQQALWEALDYDDLGGVRILRELARRRGGVSGAAIPVVFTCVLDDLADAEWLGEPVFAVTQTPQVWIDHQVFERRGELVFHWDAVRALFPTGLVDDMFAAYESLLGRLAADEAAWTDPPALLAPPAQLESRAAWNARIAPVPTRHVEEPVALQAGARPDAVAVVSGDVRITYGELDRRANLLAARLADRGVRPGNLVPIAMDKGWEQVVAALGVLRAGAAYVPLDAELPQERIEYLLADTRASCVLVQPRTASRFRWPAGATPLPVTRDGDPSAAPLAPARLRSPDDLAFVIYTSGSTGVPKGVMLSHRGVANALARTAERFDLRAEDRVLGLTPFHHDMSVFDLFGMLGAGGTLVMPDPDMRREPAHWAALLEREAVSVWNSVPAMMAMLASYLDAHPERRPRSLRLAFLGGDWIPLALPERVRQLGTRVEVVSVGGPTETSLWNIWHVIEGPTPGWRTVPYGRPIPNAAYHVLNEALEPCPAWVPGELYCAGVGLALGYLHDPVATQERFVAHPATGQRLYRTGDLGRFRPDGTIELLGRTDFQVKINGHRVELGEIEATLQKHPGVSAAVVGVAGQPGEHRRLVAHVVPERGAAVDTAALRDHLRGTLPRYMVPASFVYRDALPLSANGKVDRAALARTAADRSPAAPPNVAASADTVRGVARLIGDALGVVPPRPETAFLDLGLDSIDVLKVANALESRFGFRPTIDDFFAIGSVGDLAAFYDDRNAAPGPRRRGDATAPGAVGVSELAAKAELPADIRPASPALPREVRRVLLTGATGYLGAYLIHELLAQTPWTVTCHVRAANARKALARVRENLEAYGLNPLGWADRLEAVVGDLREPRLGLGPADWDRLAEDVDAVYHNGAWVNWIYPYSVLAPANVGATADVLRLACEHHTKRVHHVSSLAVFPFSGAVFAEDHPLDHGGRLHGGYAQSKWVAEKLVGLARERGVPIDVYRPATVTGDSRSGRFNRASYLECMIKGCVQLGQAPDLRTRVEMVPVDYVARAIVHLSRLEARPAGRTFHLTNPSAPDLRQLVEWMRDYGYALDPVPFETWKRNLSAASGFASNALYPFWPLLSQLSAEESIVPIGDCRGTLAALDGAPVRCPVAGDALFRVYFDFYVRSGFLQPPGATGSRRAPRPLEEETR